MPWPIAERSSPRTFCTLLARTGAGGPSIILIRRAAPQRAEGLASLLLANLGQVTADLAAGAVVTDIDLRVRRLPIPPGG